LIFEKTRLARFQADKTEVEIQFLKLEPLKSEDIDFIWSTIKEELRRKVEAITERISTELLDHEHLVDCKPTRLELIGELILRLT
jgi:phage terminase Nu1 subunit (DNA packaging protein)